MRFKEYLILFLFIIVCSYNCTSAANIHNRPSDTLRIAFSKASGSENYLKYVEWIKKYNCHIVCIDMIYKSADEAVKILETCDGLILTGGLDVDPTRFGRANDTSRCELDPRRDTLEFALIGKAMELKLPVVAICRGEQILNVAMGGSLIVDIPTDYGTLIEHQTKEHMQSRHYVKVAPKTFLSKRSRIDGDTVNSNHHQAVDRLADCFKVSAYADDTIIEAFEWKNPKGKQFLIAVEWHPERLDFKNRLAYPIGLYFLKATRKYMKLHK